MTVFRSANPFDQLPPGTKGLLIANLSAFVAQMIVPGFMMTIFALSFEVMLQKLWFWQLFTYAFLHGNFWHLFFNMFALWMFGPHIEAYWGTKSYLKYYFLCVLGAALAQSVIAPASVVVGASGGLYGLFLAFGFLFPDAVIYFFFVFPLRAIQAVLVIAVITFVSSLDSGGTRIAHLAHFGGLVTGFLYFKIPVWFSPLRRWFQGHKIPRFHVIHPHDKEFDLQAEVDRILDKISARGVESLTDQEHETMRRYSERPKD